MRQGHDLSDHRNTLGTSLTIREAAPRLRLSDRQVRRWIKAGKLPGAKRVGKKWLIPEDTVDRHLRPEAAAGQPPAAPAGKRSPASGNAPHINPTNVIASYVTIGEAADILEVTPRWIARLRHQGKLQGWKDRPQSEDLAALLQLGELQGWKDQRPRRWAWCVTTRSLEDYVDSLRRQGRRVKPFRTLYRAWLERIEAHSESGQNKRQQPLPSSKEAPFEPSMD